MGNIPGVCLSGVTSQILKYSVDAIVPQEVVLTMLAAGEYGIQLLRITPEYRI